jgi:hypothetical protein
MAGFCEFAAGLQAPKLAAVGAKSPKVSGGYLKYSRFWETATGDGFDLHCAAELAAPLARCSALAMIGLWRLGRHSLVSRPDCRI